MTGHLWVALLVLLPVCAWAQQQCATINCDCLSLTNQTARTQCQQQEKELQGDCAAAGGHTGYCQIAGLRATPLPFDIFNYPKDVLGEDAISAAIKRLDTINWAASEDFDNARFSENVSSYGNALKSYKSMATNLEYIFNLRRQAYSSWVALDDKGDAESVADEGVALLQEWGGKLTVRARLLWNDPDQADPALRRKEQILAMNVLRYAASAYQQAAELAALGDEPEIAANIWQLAAKTSVEMLSWRQQTNSKATYLNYFRQQGIASWSRAAIYWDRINELGEAAQARDFARELQQ